MEFTNNLVEKYGVDKLLHLLVGVSFTAIASPLGLIPTIIAGIIILILNYIKEKYLDDVADYKDLAWCGYGVAFVLVLNVLFHLILI